MALLLLLLHSAAGEEIEIDPDCIVSMRDAMASELPGRTTVATIDGKFHIVSETRADIHDALIGWPRTSRRHP